MKNQEAFLAALKNPGPIFTPQCNHQTGCGTTTTAPNHNKDHI
ncbi:hypothetical protein [Pseudoflavonifractor sp. MSJ-30]|nr:hypothetical protein [Pseudoflavonifractor sp. MSJ-30]